MPPRFPFPLASDTVVVTAGQRLARHLLDEYARSALAQGQRAWETPGILPWSVWLERLWLEQADGDTAGERLLAESQERALWEVIVRDWDDSRTLLPASAAARVAQQAWELAQAWRLPLDERDESANQEVRVFRTWAQRFASRCAEGRWLERARLSDRLVERIVARAVTLPARVVLAGFDELTPQQEHLLSALENAGCRIEHAVTRPRDARTTRVTLRNAEDEIRAAAQWVRGLLAKNSAARIGIVVPDLAARRTALVNALEDALVPQALLSSSAELVRPFNVSLGQPLAAHPLVQDALLILALGLEHLRDGRVSLEPLARLLRSPFTAEGQAEYTRRALLEACLRQRREPFADLEHLASLALATDEHGAARPYACPVLASCLANWREELERLPRRQAPAQWAAEFARSLAALGWPGSRTLASGEYQALEAWRELLGEFAALGVVLPALDRDEALYQLRRLAQERLFQPKTPPDVPVQVLGVLEAGGLEFDHLWIMGLHDEVWPRAADPNPLLPLRLQRQLKLPHASPERELEFASRVTGRLLASADEVVVSVPAMEGDRRLRPSPLVADVPEMAIEELLPAVDPFLPRDLVHATAALELLHDWQAPAHGGGAVGGGTALFELQSACPFRAFAEVRLGSAPLAAAENGLGPADRGTLVHVALQSVWDEIGTHERLRQLDDAAQAQIVARAAAKAIDAAARRRPFTMSERFRVLECERLQRLLAEWLELERGRYPFRVAATETRRRFHIEGLEIDARIDRVDVLDDGRSILMDYKTGNPHVADWFGERPAAPQLPLYGMYGVSGEVAALVYARVKRGATTFLGRAETGDLLPGVKAWNEDKLAWSFSSWSELKQRWRETLQRLAREFRAGHAPAAPRDDEACRYCPQKPFCRIHELNERAGHWALEDSDGNG